MGVVFVLHVKFDSSISFALLDEDAPPITSCFENLLYSLQSLSASVLSNVYTAPAYSAIQYETRAFFPDFGRMPSEYQGWPNDHQDALWEGLHSKGRTIQISSEENSMLYNPSIHVPMVGLEDQYMIGLDVFHQLHCLDTIRKSFYPRRYNITLLKSDGTVNYVPWLHVDHCIESIRQSLMCNADVTPMHYEWSDEIKSVVPKITVTHVCRNFDKVKKWAADRWVDWKWTDNRKVVENGKVKDYSNWKVETEEHPLPNDWAENERANEFVQ
ncbi:hypothetical protein COCC4DRAFT_209332 [Bipolaris maydis ATCC 48331]|uniref:Uncharacterized protein n=2 Tax=Cochliobolus heterostrophus TaxID=5016 RepID=M2THA4_COCH5|nr:uncharacterized protein COCC4DRAFT_209332 [Bipolaris maydis ATCC 48331]EMD85874.1 hypothetical protein COCHEDRAFT_1186824 [Bipolaris maydis C5]KAJ5025151.1 hypothetical protein J3E73DRAFT_235879 [Bipolaris maydis]ENH98746.1 hypothetical protein COCC4DRAFT_209332 [Bipolaris maydis ATCC 48331]KAJ6212882.1 hypothetical protein PSV09DRAFT_1186824 [Bipolaris maydis]KAJ6265133.1 hypothetical protein PSV08DRAFT_212883 [Bipolaris maydis]